VAPRPIDDEGGEDARARLKRKQLELEREKILLERQRVELELTKAKMRLDADEESQEESSDPMLAPAKSVEHRPRPRPASPEASRGAEAGAAPVALPRSRRRTSPNATAVAALGGLLGVASIVALLYVFGDRDKIPFARHGPETESPRVIPLPQLPPDPLPELMRLRQKAAGGDAEAMISIGNLIAEGIGGGEPDAALAGQWYQLASKEGDAAESEEAIRRMDSLLRAELEAKQRAEELAKLEAQRRSRAETRAREERESRRIDAEIEESRTSEEGLGRARRIKELEDQVAALGVGNPSIVPEDYPPLSQQLGRIAGDPLADEGIKALVARRLEEFRGKLVSSLTTQVKGHLDRGQDELARVQLERFRFLGATLPPEAASLNEQLTERVQAAAEASRKGRAEQASAASHKKSRVRARHHIDAALRWLAAHQHAEGRWSSTTWDAGCQVDDKCAGPGIALGDARYDAGLTGLALLAFLESGHAPSQGRYQEQVRRALTWLRQQQERTGAIAYRQGEEVYNHAIATRALCRAIQVFPDPQLERAASLAIDYCLVAQNPGSGWKYNAQDGRSDTSVTGWMLTALEAGKKAGLKVPQGAFKGAASFVDQATDANGATGYERPGGGSSFFPQNDGKYDTLPTMTAAGVAIRLLTGERASGDVVKKGLRLMDDNPPAWPRDGSTRQLNFYYWHYATLAHDLAGEGEGWRKELLAALLPTQRETGCADGSWDPLGEWCLAGGRVYATAINALTLTIGEPAVKVRQPSPAPVPEPPVHGGAHSQAEAKKPPAPPPLPVHELGELPYPDEPRRVHRLRRSALHGEPQSMAELGVELQSGWPRPDGTKYKNHEEAAAWYRKAAKLGNDLARSNLRLLLMVHGDLTQEGDDELIER